MGSSPIGLKLFFMLIKVFFFLLCLATHFFFYTCICESSEKNSPEGPSSSMEGLFYFFVVIFITLVAQDYVHSSNSSCNRPEGFFGRLLPLFFSDKTKPKIGSNPDVDFLNIKKIDRIVDIINSCPPKDPKNMRPLYEWAKALPIEDLRLLQKTYLQNPNNPYFDKGLLSLVKEAKGIKEPSSNSYVHELSLSLKETGKFQINDQLNTVLRIIKSKPKDELEFQLWAKNLPEFEFETLKLFYILEPKQRIIDGHLLDYIAQCKQTSPYPTTGSSDNGIACQFETVEHNYELICLIVILLAFCLFYSIIKYLLSIKSSN